MLSGLLSFYVNSVNKTASCQIRFGTPDSVYLTVIWSNILVMSHYLNETIQNLD